MYNNTFSIFLKSENIHLLVIGGHSEGIVIVQKILSKNSKINITIIATDLHSDLHHVASLHKNCSIIQREFQESDLENKDFVLINTNQASLNLEIRELAMAKKIKVNVVNQEELSDFYFEANNNNENLDHLNKVYPLSPSPKKSKKQKNSKKYRQLAFNLAVSFLLLFVGYGLSTIVSISDIKYGINHIPNEFYGMLLIGFLAQLVDGAVGLGYGVTCATSMMLLGINLPAISGSIHTAEMFSSGVSGYSHYKFGNVNKKLLIWLAIPGVLGAICGAMLLIYLGNKYVTIAYTILSIYTMIIGIRLIILAFVKIKEKKKVNNIGFLGFSGGFLDAFGGGGWGPIVTSTLLSKGRKSSFVVGTVSLAEFFVTLAAALTFFVSLGVSHWYIIVGLIVGGIIAAPIAAKLAGRLPQKIALLLVALLVIVFSIRILLKIF